MKGNTKLSTALQSIQEVGNPTIMATLTVIASMMPMPSCAASWVRT